MIHVILFAIHRYEDPLNIISKPHMNPVPAYENWIESQNIQDLQAIRFNHSSIHMESLTIRERILTTKCPDVAHPVVFRGAVCADNGRFDRCEALWLHALELRQNINVSFNIKHVPNISNSYITFPLYHFVLVVGAKGSAAIRSSILTNDSCVCAVETS